MNAIVDACKCIYGRASWIFRVTYERKQVVVQFLIEKSCCTCVFYKTWATK